MSLLDQEHKLIKIKIGDLVFDDTNPNSLSQEQMDALRKSMKRFGYLTPIIVDQNNMIADGEHRALVYKEFGYKDIPCFKITLKDDIERRLLRQVMNKLHGEHEMQKDANELLQIFQNNRLADLAELIAQPQEGLEHILTKYEGLEFQHDDNFDPDKALEQIVPITMLGDLWQLENHRIICADCTDERSISKLLNNGETKVHQLNTDPPYGVSYGNKAKLLNDNSPHKDGTRGGMIEKQYENDEVDKDFKEYFTIIFTMLKPYLADYNTIYVWSGDWHLHQIRQAAEDCGIKFSNYNIWIKTGPSFSMGRKDYEPQHEYCMYGWSGHHKFYGPYRTTLFNYNKPQHNDLHPTMKPIPLIAQTIQDGSQEGDNVLDLHLGSGTCLMACEQTKRNCYGVEIDPHYVDIVIKRWEDYTGKKAVKVKEAEGK